MIEFIAVMGIHTTTKMIDNHVGRRGDCMHNSHRDAHNKND